MSRDEAILRAIIEQELPIRLDMGRPLGMWCSVCGKAQGNPFDVAPCPHQHQYVELISFEAFRDFYDSRTERAQERLWDLILRWCEKHGPKIMGCQHLSWTASKMMPLNEDPGPWRCQACGLIATDPYEYMGMPLAS